MSSVLILIAGLIVGGAASLFWPNSSSTRGTVQDKLDLENAKEEAKKTLEAAQDQVAALQRAFAEEEKSIEKHLEHVEETLKEKEELVKRREERHEERKKAVEELQKEIQHLQAKAEEVRKAGIERLAKASNISEEKGRKLVEEELDKILSEGKEIRQKATLDELEEEVARHAKSILQIVIQRLGVPSSVDKNSTSITVKEDSFKGLLIGKEGENIRYLESKIPVAVLFNLGDTETIYVGGLNLLRRNIAKRAIQKMQKRTQKEKRITHAMIDETLAESEKEIMEECDRKGEWALKQMGLDPKNTPAELVNYIGRLYFRTSYGQNIIHHSLEMAYAARLIAEFIGSDVNTAMQAAFYHDIGKAIDHDIGGSHDDLSKEILEKHNYDPAIVHAAFVHHDKAPCESPADFIVKAVDAISGGRPGARMESVTNYFERMKQLEDTAFAFPGVSKVHTMSAGREVRVFVDKDKVGDEAMTPLGEGIAGKISEELAFPGIIKVNLIRQVKSVDYASEKIRSGKS